MTVNKFRSIGTTGVAFTSLLLTLMVFFFLVMRSGSEARAIARAQWASDVEKESEAFCRKFGLAQDSNRFSQCAADLSLIRKLHEERVAKEGAGLL